MVVTSHGANFATLGVLDNALRRNLLSDPRIVSSRSAEVFMKTYDFANSIYGWFLIHISIFHQVQLRVLTVIRTAHYPWQLVVKEDGSDIVQMAVQGEQASPSLV